MDIIMNVVEGFCVAFTTMSMAIAFYARLGEHPNAEELFIPAWSFLSLEIPWAIVFGVMTYSIGPVSFYVYMVALGLYTFMFFWDVLEGQWEKTDMKTLEVIVKNIALTIKESLFENKFTESSTDDKFDKEMSDSSSEKDNNQSSGQCKCKTPDIISTDGHCEKCGLHAW